MSSAAACGGFHAFVAAAVPAGFDSSRPMRGVWIGAATAAVLVIWWRRRRKQLSTQSEAWESHLCRLPAQLSLEEKAQLRAHISTSERGDYYALSSCPITERAEQRMEQISSVVSREVYNEHWESGVYRCARCGHPCYASVDKFRGPCMWPSFRHGHSPNALHMIRVPRGTYNKYTCNVDELYCAQCQLFFGHRFEDGRTSGDTHPDAKWRHCVLSLSLAFEADTR